MPCANKISPLRALQVVFQWSSRNAHGGDQSNGRRREEAALELAGHGSCCHCLTTLLESTPPTLQKESKERRRRRIIYSDKFGIWGFVWHLVVNEVLESLHACVLIGREVVTTQSLSSQLREILTVHRSWP